MGKPLDWRPTLRLRSAAILHPSPPLKKGREPEISALFPTMALFCSTQESHQGASKNSFWGMQC